jgi:hypothetical protein
MSSDALRDALAPFVGQWRILATFGNTPPADVGAMASFAWLPGDRFLIERWEVPVPEAPDGIAIIGADPAARAGTSSITSTRAASRASTR